MSFLVWLIAYLVVYFGVLLPAFGPFDGFFEVLGVIVIGWIFANCVQFVFDALTGRS